MNEKVKEKIRESLLAILPITAIVLFLSFTITPISTDLITVFLIGAILVIVGIGLFTMGAEMAMSVIGERIGAKIAKSKNIFYIFIVIFILGTIITIAEPDLKVLASQVSAIPELVTTLAVAIGVGLFLVIAFLRIVFQIKLSTLLFIFYGITFFLIQFVPNEFWAIAFDSGGVTTGPITVPFILALGIGATSIRESSNSENDSFGLVALCSIGPIITMLILGMAFQLTDVSYGMYEITSFANTHEIGLSFWNHFPIYAKEVGIALLPILVFFGIYQVFSIHLPKKELIKILVGIIYTFAGLSLFLVGVNIGFLPTGYLIGVEIASLEYHWIAIPIGMLIGYFIVVAEPAVAILVKQISDLTDGGIPEKAIKFNLSISIAIALGLAMVRIFTGISILWFLVPGYLIALVLSLFTPKIFTAIAFDSGGVATGPITTTFLIPFSIGICSTLGGNILTDAFGVIAFIAMMPLISIQITGVIYQLKQTRMTKMANEDNENAIIETDWEWETCLN